MNTLILPTAPSLLNRWKRPRIVDAGPSDRSPDDIALEARWHDAAVGRASLEIQNQIAQIRALRVDASWCKRGVGRRLLRALLQRARFRQIRDVYVLATTATAGFYALHGFRPADPQNASPSTDGTAHILMRRHLTPGLLSIPSAGITAKM